MRKFLRHAIALMMLLFVCKVIYQADEGSVASGVPKSLLLDSLAPEQPIPSRAIDPRPVIAAIRRVN